MPKKKGNKATGASTFLITTQSATLATGLFVIWLAEKAARALVGKPLAQLQKEDLHHICQFFSESINVENVQIPLVGNDARYASIKEKFTAGFIRKVCEGDMSGLVEFSFTGPAVEFTKFVRAYMPNAEIEKKKSLTATAEVVALANIGAVITYVERLRREGETEYWYLFVDVDPVEAAWLQPWRDLQRRAKEVVKATLLRGGGATATALVGVAAAAALVFRQNLGKIQKLRGEFVRVAAAGNKAMLKSFELVDLMDVAKALRRLRWTRAAYLLTSRYPGDQHKNLKRFVDEMAASILRFSRSGDLREVYRVVRSLSSDALEQEGKRHLGGETWLKLAKELLLGAYGEETPRRDASS